MNKVAQLLIAPNGYACTGIVGKITQRWDRSEFQGRNDKSGSCQRVILEDLEGQSIKVCFWNIGELPYGEGDFISCMPTSQGKGLTIKDNEYQGKVTKELSVSEMCSVVTSDAQSAQEEVSLDVVAPASSPAPSGGTAIPSTLPSQLVQQINLMDTCLKGAGLLRDKYTDMTDEQFQAITSCFFIESNKGGLGKSMPNQLIL